MKHFDKDKILELIESQHLDDDAIKHLDSCDQCYLEYASVRASVVEMNNYVKEKTPIKVLKQVEEDFNIDMNLSNKNFIDKIIELFQRNDVIGATSFALTLIVVLLLFNPLADKQISANKSNKQISANNLYSDVEFVNYRLQGNTRSASHNFILEDLTEYSKDELKKYSQEKNILLSIKSGGTTFLQSPKPGSLFNSKTDTLKIILPK